MVNKTKLFVIYLIILFIIIASSCNPIRKAERKVLNNVESSERVFRELEKTRPCANDTSFVTLLDTLVTTDTITNYKNDTIDNIIRLTEVGQTIYKTKKVIEIKTGYIVDTRRLGIMADSVRFYRLSLDNSINTSKKWRSRFWYLILGISAFIIIKRLICKYLNILL